MRLLLKVSESRFHSVWLKIAGFTRERPMKMSCRRLLILGVLLVGHPSVAHAGMPSIHLTDIARMRIQNISFFLLLFLVSAGAIQFIWNRLHKDWSRLPRLSYGKAVGLMALWGLLFVLVLTMISGARELMTPGAWEKNGKTYRLVQQTNTPPADDSQEKERREKLHELRVALWKYALKHEGRFPPDSSVPEIPQEKWQTPDPSGMHYVYVKGLSADRGDVPLAYEPGIFGPWRLVLLTNGDVKLLELSKIVRAPARSESVDGGNP